MKFLHNSTQIPSVLDLLPKSFSDFLILGHCLLTWFLKTDIGSGNLFPMFPCFLNSVVSKPKPMQAYPLLGKGTEITWRRCESATVYLCV